MELKTNYDPGLVKKYSHDNGKRFIGWGPKVKNQPTGFSRKLGQNRFQYIDIQRKLRNVGSELYFFGAEDEKPRPIKIEELQLRVKCAERIFRLCKNGHFTLTRADRVMAGCRCLKCIPPVSYKYSIDDLRLVALKNNGTCLSEEFKGIKKKYKFTCSRGHHFEMLGHSILRSRASWCKQCAAILRGESRRK